MTSVNNEVIASIQITLLYSHVWGVEKCMQVETHHVRENEFHQGDITLFSLETKVKTDVLLNQFSVYTRPIVEQLFLQWRGNRV